MSLYAVAYRESPEVEEYYHSYDARAAATWLNWDTRFPAETSTPQHDHEHGYHDEAAHRA